MSFYRSLMKIIGYRNEQIRMFNIRDSVDRKEHLVRRSEYDLLELLKEGKTDGKRGTERNKNKGTDRH